jgi:hypothetical protein
LPPAPRAAPQKAAEAGVNPSPVKIADYPDS